VAPIVIPKLNDMHVHLRQSPDVEHHAQVHEAFCDHVVAMPNLSPPLSTGALCDAYKTEVEGHAPGLNVIVPLYLKEDTTPTTIEAADALGIKAVKLYPRGATTGSDEGVRLSQLGALTPVFDKIRDLDMILSIHPEDPDQPALEGEYKFMANAAGWFQVIFPDLKIVFEHLSSSIGAWIVANAGTNIHGTITPHHLMCLTDDVIKDGLKPCNYCKPVLKREDDRTHLLAMATSGNPSFFLGSDSAPHYKQAKFDGAAGCYNAQYIPELLAQIFSDAGAEDKLADFASNFGADFYGVPRTGDTLTLNPVADYQIPAEVLVGGQTHLNFGAGMTLQWQRT